MKKNTKQHPAVEKLAIEIEASKRLARRVVELEGALRSKNAYLRESDKQKDSFSARLKTALSEVAAARADLDDANMRASDAREALCDMERIKKRSAAAEEKSAEALMVGQKATAKQNELKLLLSNEREQMRVLAKRHDELCAELRTRNESLCAMEKRAILAEKKLAEPGRPAGKRIDLNIPGRCSLAAPNKCILMIQTTENGMQLDTCTSYGACPHRTPRQPVRTCSRELIECLSRTNVWIDGRPICMSMLECGNAVWSIQSPESPIKDSVPTGAGAPNVT
jgi:hypothetical protein